MVTLLPFGSCSLASRFKNNQKARYPGGSWWFFKATDEDSRR